MTDAHGRSGEGRPRDRRSAGNAALTVLAVVVVAVLAIGGIAALLRSSDDGADSGTAPAAATGATSAPSPDSATGSPGSDATPTAPATKAPGTKAPGTKAPGTKAPAATAPAGSTSAVRTYRGNGDKVLKIKKPGDAADPVLVVATYRGGSNFSLFALDAASFESDILINVVGSYKGTNLLDPYGTQTRRLKVQASGPWTLKLKPVTAARKVTTQATGSGDDVLLYSGSTGLATITHRGKSNFIVQYYRGTAEVRLVDDVGPFSGEVQMPKGAARLIDVTADGKWALNVAS